MAMTKRQLQAALDALAKAYYRAHEEREKIANHCMAVYGVDPSDIDNDVFIDACAGGCGVSSGMTVEEFDASMRNYMKMAGIKMPNADVTGLAPAQENDK